MAKAKFTISVTCEWTQDKLVEILSGATYGSDWLEITVTDDARKSITKAESDCREDIWAKVLLAGEKIITLDHEDIDDDNKPAAKFLSLKDFDKALKVMGKEAPKALMRIVEGEGEADYYDYNNLLQCAMFKEIVYG